MSDRELLELAALAAGYEVIWGEQWGAYFRAGKFLAESSRSFWTPLTDDGDTLRLAALRKYRIVWDGDEVQVFAENYDSGNPICACEVSEDRAKAMRRAITRCAAYEGKQMKEQTP